MNKIVIALSGILLLAFSSKAESVGLVLSGGGAKGIAHIGVIQAFEDNNIPIDYITGTSMGAIVGGLYASGYTPDEMMRLLLSKDFADWSTGIINEKLKYYFAKPTQTPALMSFNLNFSDSAKISANLLPRSLINPLPMNFAFMELFAAYSAQCGSDFNNLFVPFRCIASDVYQKHKIICSSGSLGDAIRASMSFPVVFKPIKLDGVIAFDGGIYDNFPVDVMREDFAPDIMIGINVAATTEKEHNQNDLINQIEAMVMQPQDYSIPPKEGIKIDLDLQEFGLLDFPKAQIIYQIGYNKAMSMMDSIKSRVVARIPKEAVALRRSVFKSATPAVVFDSITVSGAKPDQNAYIKYIFTRDGKDTLTMKQAKDSYYRAISNGKIKDLIPHAKYDSRDGMFALNMTADVRDNISLGVGGYITSSTNSMIYLSAGYRTLNFYSFDADISGWVGQSYYAGELNAKVSLLTDIPSYLRLQGAMSQQKFYENDILFYSDELPSFIINFDNFIRLKYGLAIGNYAKLELGVGYGYLVDKFYQSNTVDYTKEKQDEARYQLGQVSASFNLNTLDNPMYPTSGEAIDLTAMGVYGSNKYMPKGEQYEEYNPCGWLQIEFNGSKYFQMKKFSIGTLLNAVVSTKKLFSNYTASLVQAPAFMPTPSTKNYFNPAFRANSYVAIGVIPIWKIIDNLQLRSEFYAFMPFKKIQEETIGVASYGQWFSNPSFLAEISAVYNFPFASISLYGNYLSYPAKNWNMGVSFGLLFLAPKFLR